MKIFSMKPGHDGTLALIDADKGKLMLSYEAEKDSFPRYDALNPHLLVETAAAIGTMPDVFAISGWGKGGLAVNDPIGSGYYGFDLNSIIHKKIKLFGSEVKYFSSSHERSHIWCAYGLSPFAQGQPCYILVWEGALGDFYEIDETLTVKHIGTVTKTPGNKYSFLYALADPTFKLPKGKLRFEDPGKLMALCAYGESGAMSDQEKKTTDYLINRDSILLSLAKDDMNWSPYYNIGLMHPDFTRLAKRFSDAIFNKFYDYAKIHLKAGYPLLIAGGCGLNCDWNTMWKNCGLFSDVFVPPCTNDTGSAIGTAIDAMREFTGKAKVEWSVYSGQEFIDDHPHMPDVEIRPLSLEEVAGFLNQENIIAWAKGRCEIGPRALGNRSIFAAPFSASMKDRLNAIKKREGFRPIAPICIEEDVSKYFDWQGASPHMLYFQHVISKNLPAITHADNTARVQTVNKKQNESIYKLLCEVRKLRGAGVLCNTSLNFNGAGFINRASDLYKYCQSTGIDGFVYENNFCIFKKKN